MKNKAPLIFAISLLFSIPSIAQSKFTREMSAENTVKFCNTCRVENGSVPFLIIVKHRKEEKALEKAKLAAVMKILISGIPGSSVSQGILTASQFDSNEKFFDKFFDSKTHERYVSEVTIDPENTFKIKNGPQKGAYEAGMNVVVQYETLKKYLIEKEIIKFGL